MDQDLQYHSSEVCNLFDGGVEPEIFFTVENPRQSVLPSFPYFRFVIELAERLDKHSLGYILPKYTSWWLVFKYAYSDCFFLTAWLFIIQVPYHMDLTCLGIRWMGQFGAISPKPSLAVGNPNLGHILSRKTI